MPTCLDYELLDFGDGRKLERFGPYVMDRPSPSATGKRHCDGGWHTADARFERANSAPSGPQRGVWQLRGDVPPAWPIHSGSLQFELKRTDFGHIGIFPEQIENWNWIYQCLGKEESPTPTVLNLFAYTGGSTLAAALAGAVVTHVDAAANIVAWARRNATQSGLSSAPIRWVAEDALKFARRELHRGRHYDAVILDPPSYGHGPGGEVWKIDEHLPELLNACCQLTGPRPRWLLLTCHAPPYDPLRLVQCLRSTGFSASKQEIDAGDLWLTTASGRRLHSGCFVRLSAG
ncbi:MAG: class I SAM-dependent methyltransferase [Pirellulales bacterium]|nr:class I SAM-dependent methyltransferase [Pirellulales bacterium]